VLSKSSDSSRQGDKVLKVGVNGAQIGRSKQAYRQEEAAINQQKPEKISGFCFN